MGIAAHPASALDCAQSREASATGKPVKTSLCTLWNFLENVPPSETGTHKKPVRTLRLTSSGSSPVPPSEFSCNALADPKVRFCRDSPTTRHSSMDLPASPKVIHNPLTLRHLTCSECSLPERLAQLRQTNPCVPLFNSQDAPPAPLHSLSKLGWAEKTRNRYRSASRLSLQVLRKLMPLT